MMGQFATEEYDHHAVTPEALKVLQAVEAKRKLNLTPAVLFDIGSGPGEEATLTTLVAYAHTRRTHLIARVHHDGFETINIDTQNRQQGRFIYLG